MPIDITQENIEKEIKQSTKPVIVDVHATWCGPCQQMRPVFDELEQELSELYTFAALNVDEARDIAVGYGVSTVPTFIFIKDGEVKGKATGIHTKEELVEKIETAFGS